MAVKSTGGSSTFFSLLSSKSEVGWVRDELGVEVFLWAFMSSYVFFLIAFFLAISNLFFFKRLYLSSAFFY